MRSDRVDTRHPLWAMLVLCADLKRKVRALRQVSASGLGVRGRPEMVYGGGGDKRWEELTRR